MSYQQIIPCSGWNYTHDNPTESGKSIVHPVAAWALTEAGDVVGLIAVDSKQAVTSENIARLVAPPPVGGKYVRAEQ